MPAQTTPITERQLNLITRAHCDAGGLIEPLLELKGGAKLKMIASLARRGLIEQIDGQWRITRTAITIIKGEAKPEEVLPPRGMVAAATTPATLVQTTPPPDDPEMEAAAETTWQQDQPAGTLESPKRVPGNSKQALVIEMLKRPEGTTITQICEATGWQAHTVRGAFAGVLKKKLGLTITSDKPEGCERIYRIV